MLGEERIRKRRRGIANRIDQGEILFPPYERETGIQSRSTWKICAKLTLLFGKCPENDVSMEAKREERNQNERTRLGCLMSISPYDEDKRGESTILLLLFPLSPNPWHFKQPEQNNCLPLT
ncbi:hypothetical protein JTE90_007031 [Oedothorax gibbosus]|uniref:Uncharacterized protein n=1 Tax=Oedothorax gibbosus TaxID=931172 RepID=A0AAV6U830_9ARAC|nr:hypothetical protein JTE90_007031 [Oedothorax gibbosus]